MRGIDTQVRKNRRRIFKEVADLAYNSQNLIDDIEALPYKIVDYDESEYQNIYRERSIVRERLRLAMGMSLRPENRPVHLTQGLEESNISEKYYEPPLMQIFQLIRAMQEGHKIIAQLAPAFVGQFGPDVTPDMLKTALKELGFYDVYETALGADQGAMYEASQYVNEVVSGDLPFSLTSCCPSWAVLAKKYFPETIDKISNTLTPMVATARIIKKEHPDAKVVFIGPCASKKLEASRRTIRSDVDFVITFEELTGMFEAKGILPKEIQAMDELKGATGAGRDYGVAGGVASAIEDCIKAYYPDTEVKIEHAEGLSECKKMLILAKAGKKDGCLIEGMACLGGCVAGAGTNIAIVQAAKELKNFKEAAELKIPEKK